MMWSKVVRGEATPTHASWEGNAAAARARTLQDAYAPCCACRGILRDVLRRPDVIGVLRRDIASEMAPEQTRWRAEEALR
jgi:hypothetical protein